METVSITEFITSMGTYVLGLGVFIATFFLRRVVEMLLPSWKKRADANDPKLTYLTEGSRWWNEVLLYAIPVLLGCAAGFLKSDFLFPGLNDLGAKILFGGAVGWFSSFLYKALRKALKEKVGIDPVPSPDSIAPEAPPGD